MRKNNENFVWFVVFFAVFLWLVSSWVDAAKAHDWYPHDCCSGQDCQPIHSVTVAYGFGSGGEEGYHIHLYPRDHKMVKREQRYFVPMRSIREVPETAPEEAKNQWHVCIGKATQIILCAWKPRSGV